MLKSKYFLTKVHKKGFFRNFHILKIININTLTLAHLVEIKLFLLLQNTPKNEKNYHAPFAHFPNGRLC